MNNPKICFESQNIDQCFKNIQLAIMGKNPELKSDFCDNINDSKLKEDCLIIFTQKWNNVENCKKAYKPKQEKREYENCIINVAIKRKKISLCNEIDHDYRIYCILDYIKEIDGIELNNCFELSDEKILDYFQDEYYLNTCLENLAEKKQDSNFCLYFKGEDAWINNYNCFTNFAVKQKDITLCKQVKNYSPNHNQAKCEEFYKSFSK